MSKKVGPKITNHKGKDFTCITFYPDLKRFKLSRLTPDFINLLKKRVF